AGAATAGGGPMVAVPSRPAPAARAGAAFLLAVCLAAAGTPAPAPAQAPPAKLALLVGCTAYPHCKGIPALDGPANDVGLFARLLVEQFGFAPADVAVLSGWPAEEKKRPSYRNVVAAFEDLVRKAGPGTQVFILLAGHGVQVPIPASRKAPLDPRHPKLDGTDKVFLPADVNEWQGDRLDNALLDHQIGRFLDRLAEKGA